MTPRGPSGPFNADMASSNPGDRPSRTTVAVDAGRLWGGGFATACVAALVAVAGVLIFQGVLDIRLVRPALLVDVAHSFAADYALTAFLAALAATAVAHTLALVAPRPRTFFGWLMAVATVCGAAAPFAIGTETASQVATACINVALGICIGSLLGAVLTRTVTTVAPAAA